MGSVPSVEVNVCGREEPLGTEHARLAGLLDRLGGGALGPVRDVAARLLAGPRRRRDGGTADVAESGGAAAAGGGVAPDRRAAGGGGGAELPDAQRGAHGLSALPAV